MPSDSLLAQLDTALAADDAERTRRYPGPPTGRRRVHAGYVPADRVTPATVADEG